MFAAASWACSGQLRVSGEGRRPWIIECRGRTAARWPNKIT